MRTQRAATAVSVPAVTSGGMDSAWRTSPLVWPGMVGWGQGYVYGLQARVVGSGEKLCLLSRVPSQALDPQMPRRKASSMM